MVPYQRKVHYETLRVNDSGAFCKKEIERAITAPITGWGEGSRKGGNRPERRETQQRWPSEQKANPWSPD